MVTVRKFAISVACLCLLGLAACSGEVTGKVSSGPNGNSGEFGVGVKW
jgi:hypothetical protein